MCAVSHWRTTAAKNKIFSYDLIFCSFGPNVYINLNHKSHTKNKNKKNHNAQLNKTQRFCSNTATEWMEKKRHLNRFYPPLAAKLEHDSCLHLNWHFFLFSFFYSHSSNDVMFCFAFWEFALRRKETETKQNEIGLKASAPNTISMWMGCRQIRLKQIQIIAKAGIIKWKQEMKTFEMNYRTKCKQCS